MLIFTRKVFRSIKHIFMTKKICFFLLIALHIGCKSVTVNNQLQRTTTAPVELGTIGLHEDYYPYDRFTITTTPKLDRKVRVKAVKHTFNKRKFNAYENTSPYNRMQLQYIDSLPDKPEYIALELIDHVNHTAMLNEDPDLLDYLKTRTGAFMVTSVAAALHGVHVQAISNAESVFLVYDPDISKYYLEINNRDKTILKVRMEDMDIFAYGLSFFCWGENPRHRLEIKDIVEEDQRCPDGTYKKASKVKKKVNYFKL